MLLDWHPPLEARCRRPNAWQVLRRASLRALSNPQPSGAVAAKTPATSTARDADYLLDDNYLFGQNMTEYNPAPSPSGHPLLSGQRMVTPC
eukprot:scaffold59453_cov53-Phaeocystis_antarctica.AAC.1